MEISELEENRFWYVRLPGATALSAVKVVDVTELTVAVVVDDPMRAYGLNLPSRYAFRDLEFVEAY